MTCKCSICELNRSTGSRSIRILVLADGETWERLGSGDAYVVDLTEEEYARIQDDEKPHNVVDLAARGRKVT